MRTRRRGRPGATMGVWRVLVLGGLLAMGPAPASALPILSARMVLPPTPGPADFVRIAIRGEFPSTGYHILTPPHVALGGMEVAIDLFAFGPPPGTIVLPVIVPFTVTADIGPLHPGTYADVSTLVVDGQPVSALRGSFAVVPEPGTALLVAAGLAALGGARRWRGHQRRSAPPPARRGSHRGDPADEA